jgi:predicted DNA-binding ribbon-helix-helix protein
LKKEYKCTTNDCIANFYSTLGFISMPVESSLISRNVTVLGKRTSIRLEAQMWSAMKEIAEREHCSIHELCSLIAMRRKQGLSLTASIRIFLMLYFKAACSEEGHAKAGHGSLDRMVGRLMPVAQKLAGQATENSQAA